MKTQIKIPIFIALVMLIGLSCSKEEVSNPEEFKVAKQQVQFDFTDMSEGNDIVLNHSIATIISVAPLVIESEDLEVISFIDQDSNEFIEIIVHKDDEPEKEPCEFDLRKGHKFFFESLCFEYGYWIRFSDCSFTFHSFGDDKFVGHKICLKDFFKPKE